MQPLNWESRPDGLRAPALVCAFKGWNDAADAASSALTFVGSPLGAERFARHRSRGVLRLPGDAADGPDGRGPPRGTIEWPEVEIYEAAGAARAARPHPALRPRALVSLAHVLRRSWSSSPRRSASSSSSRSARCWPTSRTRARSPSPGSRSDAALVERLGAGAVLLRGPDRDRRRPARRLPGGGPAVGLLWAAVPHYIAATPNPKAALALVRKLEGLVGVDVDALATSSRPRPTTSARYSRSRRRPRRPGRSSSASSRPPRMTTAPSPGTFRRATCSRASSSASCGSARRTRTDASHDVNLAPTRRT